MQILKLLASFSLALACVTSQASPELQLGITDGSYDSGSSDVITTDDIFTLNSYGKETGGNAVSLGMNYFVSIAILAEEGLNPANFGSFLFGANTYTLSDMVFGNPPLETNQGHEGGDLSPHGIYDTWFLQYAFQFSNSSKTSEVNTENTPAFDPLTNAGTDYFFKSFTVNTQGLFAGYNLHFDLFTTAINNKTGDTTISSNAPFSYEASTAYSSSAFDVDISSVPEPSTIAIFGSALAGLYFSRRLVRPPVTQKIDE
jgi:hypothetical protein